jgi:hypothetical protein
MGSITAKIYCRKNGYADDLIGIFVEVKKSNKVGGKYAGSQSLFLGIIVYGEIKLIYPT